MKSSRLSLDNLKLGGEIVISGIVFDFDLTLVDSAKAICGNLNALAEEKSLRPLGLEEVRKTIGWALVDAMKSFWGDGPAEEEWLPRYRKLFVERNYAGLEGFPQTVPALEKIRSMGMSLGIATNRLTPMGIVKAAGLDGYFDAVVGIEGLPPKPDPSILLEALSRMGTSPENSVYVGDTDIDMRTALNGGVMGIGVATGNHTVEQLLESGARFAIRDLSELPDLVEKLQ